MIHVSWRHCNGSIKYCSIHDLLRNLAIEKAKENNFLHVISNQGVPVSSSSTVRRVALHCAHCEDVIKIIGRNLRSLLYFCDDMANVSRSKYLKVLCSMRSDFLENWHISKKMTQLRYLGNFSIGVGSEIKVWKNISRMRNLQTLLLGSSDESINISDGIWNNQTLRHVISDGFELWNDYNDGLGGILSKVFLSPPSRANLPNLQTLKIGRVRASWLVEGWPKMPNIRVLRLEGVEGLHPKYNESFCSFLSSLHHLTSLHVTVNGDDDDDDDDDNYSSESSWEMFDMSALPSYNKMQSLHVEGEGFYMISCKALSIGFFPIHLLKLSLRYFDIKEDPMPVLEKLRSLKRLVLWKAYYVKELYCSTGGFPHLEYLEFRWLNSLAYWKVEKGGMPLLKQIHIEGSRGLVGIGGLEHMTNLTNLSLDDVHPDLHERLGGEESYKIQHVPFVKIE